MNSLSINDTSKPEPLCKELRTPNDTVHHVAPIPEVLVYLQGPYLPQLLHCLNCIYHHIPDQDVFISQALGKHSAAWCFPALFPIPTGPALLCFSVKMHLIFLVRFLYIQSP